MAYTNAAKNSMLASVVGKTPTVVVDTLSIHTADPGGTGASEVASGSYARVAVSDTDFDAPASGEVLLNNDKAFVAAAAETATFFGCWDAAVFVGGGPITGDTAFNAEGNFVLKAGTTLDLNG